MKRYQVNLKASVCVCFSLPLKQCLECYNLVTILGEKKKKQTPKSNRFCFLVCREEVFSCYILMTL